MVGVGDVKFYKTLNNLGGTITATQITSASANNMFTNALMSDIIAGKDYYGCMFVKNTHISENMEKFNFWLGTDTLLPDTKIRWAFEVPITTASGYRWQPYFTSTGSNKDETAHSASLQLSQFTICGWFKTATAPVPDEGFILNKGGTGSETAGQNLNYGLWMGGTGKITGGFETSAGTDNYAVSPLTYHDNNWHFALVYYDGTTVNLYVDNMVTPVATTATTATPETSSNPLRINQNSRTTDGWFPSGAQLDEIRLWNRALTSSAERQALYENSIVTDPTGLLLEKKFGPDEPVSSMPTVAQTIADQFTAPVGVIWNEAGVEPLLPNVGTLRKGSYFPVWVNWRVEPNAVARKDDACFFNFSFFIPSGGTGDQGTGGGTGAGGGTGGSLTTDRYGIRQIYKTKTGGREYFSNWDLPSTTTHTWTPTGQTPGNLDPQDSMADLVSPDTCKATVDAENDYLIADTNADRNSWRYYIKDPAATTASSPWKWDPSMEITAYYMALKDYSGGSIHCHLRLMGPTEHWIAISNCGAAGHEYSYEIKKNGVNQFRKEQVHVGGDAGGYSDNIIFDDNSAPYNKWIGMKLITKLVNATTMKVEAWKDTTDGLNGGNWIKQGEMIDDGTNWTLPSGEAVSNYNGLPAGSGNCAKITPMDRALTMACTAIGLRCDNTQIRIKKFSGREIDATDPGSGGSGGSSGGGGTGGGTGGNPPPPTSEYAVAFCGDWGCEKATDDVIDLLTSKGYAEHRPDRFLVGVGDNAYASSSCWINRFQKFLPEFNSSYGNHEYSESGGIGPYKSFFGHTKTYFTFKFQNILFVVADTNISCDPGGTQHAFIKQALEEAENDNSIKWKIAIMHHQWYGGASSHSHNEADQVQAFHSLFMEHKVAFVVVGHIHNWQRTYQCAYNSSNPTNPTIVNTTAPYTVTNAGIIHVVSGTGGHDSGSALYGIGTQPPFNAYQNRTHNGIWEILASNNGTVFRCSYVEIGGDEFDTFIINAAP